MQVKIKYGKEKEKVEVKDGDKIEDALDKVGINRETVVVKRNGKIIPPEEEVNDGDYLECIRIISGG